MAMQQEILRSSVVAVIAILRTFGCCPLPQASVVALVAIQTLSLLGFLFNSINAQPSKRAKIFSAEEALPTVTADAVRNCLRSCAKALLSRAAVRNAVWAGLAVLSKQFMRVVGFSASPCFVLIFACALGAAIQYTASVFAKSQGICCAAGPQDDAAGACKILRCPYEPTFWPSMSCDGNASDDVVPESPLAAMALDTTFRLQLPPIELETECFLNGDKAQPSRQARVFSAKRSLPTVGVDAVRNGLRFCARELVARVALRNGVWVGLAILSRQLMQVIGFGASPLLVIVFACALGAAIQYAASALAKTQVGCGAAGCQCDAGETCKTLRCAYEPAFWASTLCDGKAADDVATESPLAAMALDTSFRLQLPQIASGTED